MKTVLYLAGAVIFWFGIYQMWKRDKGVGHLTKKRKIVWAVIATPFILFSIFIIVILSQLH